MHDGFREHLQLEKLTNETNVAKGTSAVLHLQSFKLFFELLFLLSLCAGKEFDSNVPTYMYHSGYPSLIARPF